jgi:hypothetical protein
MRRPLTAAAVRVSDRRALFEYNRVGKVNTEYARGINREPICVPLTLSFPTIHGVL